jgi:hypothetical protein
MMATVQRYRLLASLAGFVLALLYPLVFTGNARADDLNPAADPAVNSALQAVPAATSQGASTEQAADAAAQATQQDPRNLVVSVRIDSPGNDGSISQTNVAGSAAGATNDASTGQEGASGEPASQQQAATDQAATATATTTQDQPQNIVIVIRINSPGDSGPIEQTNIAVAVSNAGNVSVSRQGGGGADGAAAGASPDPRAAIGPPAQQASTPAGEVPRMAVAVRAPAATRKAIAGGRGSDRVAPPAASAAHRSDGERAKSAPSSTQTASSEPTNPPVTATSGAREPLARVKPVRRAAAVQSNRTASSDPGVGRRAVDLLGKLAPRSPVQASRSEQDVTNAVVLTLIAVLGALVVFFGSTYSPSGLRQLDPRSWRHR